MKIETIAFRNDGNYVSEDGTVFVMKSLNPNYGKKNEPEYITQEIPVNPNDAWVQEYMEQQHSWATSQEREEDERVDVSKVPVDADEDPMQVLLGLIENPKGNPEVALGVIGDEESEQKKIIVALLTEYKEELAPAWQTLLDKIYGEQMRISDIQREDLATTGETKSNQAYSKQFNKAIEKLKACFEAAGYEVDRTPKRKHK